MVFKNFTFLLFLRLFLILAISFLIAFIFLETEFLYTGIILSIVFIGQIIEIAAFVGKTNYEISRFIDAITYNEFTTSFPHKKTGNHFGKLYKSLNNFLEKQKQIKSEQEAHFQFISTIVNQIKTGIIASNHEGKVILMNQAASEILNLPKFEKIEKFEQRVPQLFDWTDKKAAKNKKVISFDTGVEFKSLSVFYKAIKIKGNVHKVFTFQDINDELGNKELEAWNKLISILTHEIMNSITPILSLSESVSGLLINKEGKTKLVTDINNEDLDDIQVALKTINNRSKSLLKCVKDYRKMSKIPVPELNPVNLNELIFRIIKLFEPQIIKNQIDFKTHIPNPKITINTDAGLLEQVIINLLINSVDSMCNSKHKTLTISAYQNNLNTIIEVKDTGCGIKKEVLDRIFVPFYSTKNHGSGIGLSLSKQIINVLEGTIKIDTKPNAGTTFYLVF